MSISISVEKARKSRVKRLSFLPRFGFYMDFGGRQLAYRQVPVLETLFNLRSRRLPGKDFFDIVIQQLREVDMPKQENVKMPAVKKARKKAATKR